MADIVMFLYRDDYHNKDKEDDEVQLELENTSLTELSIAKNRSGARGVIELMFEKNTSKFYDVERNYE